MAQENLSEREAIAIAACDVAGRERPLPSTTPREGRVYLYATPHDEARNFSADELRDRLESVGVQHGIDRDASSPMCGVRFISRRETLPVELRPFTTPEAQKTWSEWRDRERLRQASVTEAARIMASGGRVEFAAEDEILPEARQRRRDCRRGERD